MLTDKQLIDAARASGFLVYENNGVEMLSAPLTEFAQRIEELCRPGPRPVQPPTQPRAA